MRDVFDGDTQDVRATEAVALFCYQIKKQIDDLRQHWDELDQLVFAGGIGEHAPTVRARICEGRGFLGIEREEKQSAAASRVAICIMCTNEELMIARSVCRSLGLGA